MQTNHLEPTPRPHLLCWALKLINDIPPCPNHHMAQVLDNGGQNLMPQIPLKLFKPANPMLILPCLFLLRETMVKILALHFFFSLCP